MKKSGFFVLLAAVALLFASCTSFQASGLAYRQQPQGTPSYTVLGDFQRVITVNAFLGSSGGTKLFNATADVMDGPIHDVILKEIAAKGGTGAINIKVVQKASFINILLNSLTATIYAPCDVEISGTVIKEN